MQRFQVPTVHVGYTHRNPTEIEDLKHQVHCLEKEAYSHVLRAFIAQSDLLSWAKEGLITELRKELNVTDTEHGELLVKINSDESIKLIREWRKGAHQPQESLYGKVNTPAFAPNSEGNALQKKAKTSHASASKSQRYVSLGKPSLGTQSRTYVPHMQPSGSVTCPLPAKFNSDQQGVELFSSGNPEQPLRKVSHNYQVPSNGTCKVPGKSQSKRGFNGPGVKKRRDTIKILATDKLIHHVEKTVYGTEYPSLVQVERAKLLLRVHETALLEALDKLADVSDGDDDTDEQQHHLSYKELPRKGQQGMVVRHELCRQAGAFHGYHSEGSMLMPSIGLGGFNPGQ